MLIEMIKCVFTGMYIGFKAFLSVLPFYEQLNSIKEQLIAGALGISPIIVSIAFTTPIIIRIVRKILF